MPAQDTGFGPDLIAGGEKLASSKRVLKLNVNLYVGRFMWGPEYGTGNRVTTVQFKDSRCEAPLADPNQGWQERRPCMGQLVSISV